MTSWLQQRKARQKASDPEDSKVKARAFDYVRVASLEAARAAFTACAGEARYLAGGQSLLAALNLRLDAPGLLIDIAHIPALEGVALDGDSLRIGALTRHSEILTSPLVAAHAPLFAAAAAYVAHPAIRNKGTMGGSLALADPASEFPASALCLDASIEIAGQNGLRRVAARDFFQGLYETDLTPGDIVTALLVPVRAPSHVFFFDELARRRGDYAMAGLAARAEVDGGRCRSINLSFFAVAPSPVRARHVEEFLAGKVLDEASIEAAKMALATDLAPEDDAQISGATRLHLAKVLLARALRNVRRQSIEMEGRA